MPPQKISPLTQVKKRDGRLVDFDLTRVSSAVSRAMQSVGEGDLKYDSQRVAAAVKKDLERQYVKDIVPDIENIQDAVEKNLILMDFPKTAKAYILYRHKRAEIRKQKKRVPFYIKKLTRESRKYFRNALAEFVFYRSYSRWLEKENRRETWIETVDRYFSFMKENLGDKLSPKEYQEIREAVLRQEVMPSMRLLWSAGGAARATNVAAYNCSFIAPAKLEDFADIMYVSMCGAGVGFSVESQTAQALLQIKKQSGRRLKTHFVEDSKEGWCEALTFGLKTWFSGKDADFDYSGLRPEGARLKIMGGKSSGPGPLKELLNFTRDKILARQGRRLSNIDVYDLVCKIGEIVVSGGVRRSALISLSDLDDQEMRDAKKGQFYLKEPQRSLANNSAVYNQKPTGAQFLEEWLALMKSGSGERGIFNRGSLEKQMPPRRWKKFKNSWPTSGTNPCGEIVLKSKSFCNLSEVVARREDDEKSLLEKTRLAAILGTYQSMLTDFHFISKEWKKNCEEERLLGVSITGQWDSPAIRDPKILRKMRETAVKTNQEYAKKFGINPSAAVTCVKPSGTVSQLVGASSGMHPRYSPYFIRRIRISATDSLFQMLKDQKVPYKPEVGQFMENANTYIIEFPIKSPKGAIFRNNLSALDQLEYWKKVKENFTEHNPSVTISVGEEEWVKVAHWLYENWEIIGGLSFLPREEHVYKLAPYEEITKEQYEELSAKFPKVDFSQIMLYETDDDTEGAKELACVAGACEI
ncbi:MAG: ATP cone domain-containing protein [Patescibacteria group bacterium]